MSSPCVILWFRSDLRLHDNPALLAALDTGLSVIPVFIASKEESGELHSGAASRVWLHHSLKSLDRSLLMKKSKLVLRTGAALSELKQLIRETGATHLFWNRRYEPEIMERDKALKEDLRQSGIVVESFNSALLFEPWKVLRDQGGPYQVFTAYWNKCLTLPEPEKAKPAPKLMKSLDSFPSSEKLEDLKLLPKLSWDKEFYRIWKPGESGAQDALKFFLKEVLVNYKSGRDIPSDRGTSRLSPHLHFGEISIREVWHAIKKIAAEKRVAGLLSQAECYLRELGWREFAHHLLYHFPKTVKAPLRKEFQAFSWIRDKKLFKSWSQGKTGYPMIDAGMRELWRTGWMHNRVRMIVASFLVKDLLISWKEGERWFWDTLVDADLANNTFGWQWSAGCGADAAPFFRIFNPVSQGTRFDPKGSYVRKWVPEIAKLPDEWIHQPWLAPADLLKKCGIELDKNYPLPVIDHSFARKRALLSHQKIKNPQS